MSIETKTTPNLPAALTELGRQAGILIMAAAVSFGMFDHSSNRVVLPGRVALAPASENEELNNPLRRESQETAPQYISYSETQRTPSRSGKY
ncbi:MAG TPA: hypothetical protein VK712_00830 [Verrucomicrobiae bacterium]|jgi:hypothetical protein|nr:hypothetical protein [Verrucomicrobiae bacterium]